VKITVVAVGRVRGSLAPAVAEYEERAARYWKLEVVEVDAGAPGRAPTPERVRSAEGDRLLGRIGGTADVFALTRQGRGSTSEDLARTLQDLTLRSSREVAFVIGGAFGLDARVLARAGYRYSLSSLTFPHEMARLLLAEQLYRAGTILRGEPYHKGA
jgi:23S rRNA (pseudouridine1915-N3)-methyltransferase